MLVAISDIHFVDGTAGEHNLPFGAFNSVFLSDICALASEKDAKEVKVLLLGDIVDLIRSTKWFDVKPEDRPWGKRGLSDIPRPRKRSVTEKQCLKILGQASQRSLGKEKPPSSLPKDTVLYKNWKTFKLFRELRSHLSESCGREIAVEVIYIPGNHDRLCNLYPSVRDAIHQALGVSVTKDTVEGDSSAEWWYRVGKGVIPIFSSISIEMMRTDEQKYGEYRTKREAKWVTPILSAPSTLCGSCAPGPPPGADSSTPERHSLPG